MEAVVSISRALLPALPSLLLALAACGPKPPCGLRVCDIRESSCQQDTAAATACLRGLATVAVPIKVIKQADYLAAAEAQSAGADVASFQRWLRAYAYFGLADPSISVTASSREQAAWVAAFYQSVEQGITIVDAGRPLDSPQAVSLLVHEVTHALQDRHVGFGAFAARVGAVDLDRILASKAITEGEASLVEDLSALGLFGAVEGDVAWRDVFASWQARNRRAAVASPLPVSLAWGQFPYPFGTPYVHAAYRAEGFAGVDRLYREPPVSTAQVLAGPGARETTGRPWFEHLGAEVLPVLPERLVFQGGDRLGAWVLEVFLSRLRQQGRIDAAATALLANAPTALRADAFSIYFDMAAGEVAACWRMRFASADVALGVLSLLRTAGNQPFHAWSTGRDLMLLASDRPETVALAGPALAWKGLPPETTPAAAAAAAVEPRCVQRLD
jgi:hypothetical protein